MVSSARLAPPASARPLRGMGYSPPLRRLSGPPVAFRLSSRTKLRPRDAPALEARGDGSQLFSQMAVAVCSTGVLPRKEFFEAWEVANRVDRTFPSTPLVADLASGHGLLAWMLLLLGAARGSQRRAVCVDTRLPDSAITLSGALGARWPELKANMQYVEGSLEAVSAEPGEALFVSVHACGPLSDMVINKAVSSSCPFALMPCCHSLRKQPLPPLRGLSQRTLERMAVSLGQSNAIDACRVAALRDRGYSVEQQFIPSDITPYNRLILAQPSPGFKPSLVTDYAATMEPHNPIQKRRARMSGPRAQWPTSIPIGDPAAVAAISGRRAPEWCRSIELSMWMPSEGFITQQVLLSIAVQAVQARWVPRVPEAKGGSDVEASAPLWDAQAVAAAAAGAAGLAGGARDAGPAAAVGGALSSAQQRPAEALLGPQIPSSTGRVTVSVDGVRVAVSLREVFFAPETRRRACAFKVDFRSSERAVTKGDASMWQARMREALQVLSALTGGFELR